MPRAASKNLKKIPIENGKKKKIKSREFIDEVSESEDSTMSDEEEEEEWEAEEEENETTEESNDEGDDSDASVDEGPSVGSESNTSGSGQYRKKKEDAKRSILKRKRGKEQEKKVKRIKHDDEAGEKDLKTVAAAASRVAETKKGKSVRKNDEIKAKPIEALEKQPTSSTECCC
ncbi:hypothetical protein DAPPUDRAFT_268934 [Daphnia pulex]|uniref:Uncharacterized protein n=1 Tax=Daphnia pulex TaxID=6669 RepID=E9HYJ5_DAPPU|nr:hypothetical protein DAPPUDRAFT_268934 [Daphnia pulex]|eukprot:EFX63185.1 hypothetical protein DAPPUDRAFT_268934 [Daphnia pulex]